MGLLKVVLTGDRSRAFSSPSPAAARSLAIPRTPRQSARSGVIAISIMGSSKPAILANPSPILLSLGSSIIPSCSSEIPISRSEHNIPLDASPLITPFFNSSPVEGILAPAGAKTPLIPVRAFGAPQTTCTFSEPVSTIQTRNLSALGC